MLKGLKSPLISAKFQGLHTGQFLAYKGYSFKKSYIVKPLQQNTIHSI